MKLTLADLYLQAIFAYRRTLSPAFIDAFYASTPPSPNDHLIPALLYLARYGDPDKAPAIHQQLAAGDYTILIETYTKLDNGEIAPPKRGRKPAEHPKPRPSRAGHAAARRAKFTARIMQAARKPFEAHEDDPDQDT